MKSQEKLQKLVHNCTQFFDILYVVILVGMISGCSLLKEQEQPVDLPAIASKPLPPEKTEELLEEVGSNWLYGQGLGNTAVTVGTVAAFPPYAVWVVGNAALTLSGYEPIHFSDLLPEEEGEIWSETYDSVASGPGQVAASMAGKEFRTREVAREKIKRVMEAE